MPHRDEKLKRKFKATSVVVPKINTRGFDRDPVGAGLDSLQDALRFGITIAQGKEHERETEALTQADVLLQAMVVNDEETAFEDFAVSFRDETGYDISSITPAARRRHAAANGQIAATQFGRNLRDDVISGKFKTEDELKKILDERVQEIRESGNDANYLNSFLVHADEPLQVAKKMVFETTLMRKVSEQKATISNSFGSLAETYATNPEPEALDDFRESMKNLSLDQKNLLPNQTQEQYESAFIADLQTFGGDPDNLDEVPEIAEIFLEEGVISSPKGKKILQDVVNSAEKALNNYALEATPEQKKNVFALNIKLLNTLQAGKDISEIRTKMEDAGNLYGLTQYNKTISAWQAAERFNPATGESLGNDFAKIQKMRANGDSEGIAELMSSPGWYKRNGQTTEGQALIKTGVAALKETQSEKQVGLSTKRNLIEDEVVRLGLDADDQKPIKENVKKDFQEWVDANPKSTPSEQNEWIDKRMSLEKKKQQDDENKLRLQHEPPRTVTEGNIRISGSTEELEKVKEIHIKTTSNVEYYENLKKDYIKEQDKLFPHASLTGVRGINPQPFQFKAELEAAKKADDAARIEEEKAEKRVRQDTRLRDNLAKDAKKRGLSEDDAILFDLYVGSPEGTGITNQMRQ